MSERVEVFIDGENLLTRFEAMVAEGWARQPRHELVHIEGLMIASQSLGCVTGKWAQRVSYYTAVAGDEDALEELRNTISRQKYGPQCETRTYVPKVFKKEKRSTKTKSVDINLTTDLLRAAYSGTADRFVVISGDGDYIPVYEEVMRQGKRVSVAALSSGLNKRIAPRVDEFHLLDGDLFSGRL